MQLYRLVTILALSSVTFNTLTDGNAASANGNTPSATGRLIVEFQQDAVKSAGLGALQGDNKSTDSTDHRRWAADRGLRQHKRLSSHTHLLKRADGVSDVKSLQRLAHRLTSSDAVLRASVEYKRFTLLQPDDPLYLGNGLEPGSQNYLYDGPYSLRAPGAWDITTGSTDTVIAVVDTGVLADHPDLINRSVPSFGYDFVSADFPGDFTSANDGDGRDDNPSDPGDHCAPNSSSWHGTGVASVAAGTGNNAEGIAGVDWNARILHARALGRCGGTDADIIDAVRWSAGLPVSGLPINDAPATVVNLSIGGPTECTPAWQNVIDELNALDIPFVIAAGNEATNALRSSPANCADVITVGSNSSTGDIDNSFSNYGLKVTVAAPGRDILLATNDGLQAPDEQGYSYYRGTGSSFSAALVSGAIGLMQSLNADLSPAAVRAILQMSASQFTTEGDCGTYYCGTGILNMIKALQLTRDGDYEENHNSEAQILSAQLNTLNLDEPNTGVLSGYRDIRYFKLPLNEPGLLTITSDSEADLYGYLLNDSFSVLTMDDDSHTDLNFSMALPVKAGMYYLAVERAVHRRNDGESAFTLNTSLMMEQPDPFSFPPVNDAELNAPVYSESIQLSGLAQSAVVTITDGSYSVNGGAYTRDRGLVENGDAISVSLQSSANAHTSTSLTLTVGAYTTEFLVTTGEGNALPTGGTTTQSGPDSKGASSGGGCTYATNSQTDLILPLLVVLASISILRRRLLCRLVTYRYGLVHYLTHRDNEMRDQR